MRHETIKNIDEDILLTKYPHLTRKNPENDLVKTSGKKNEANCTKYYILLFDISILLNQIALRFDKYSEFHSYKLISQLSMASDFKDLRSIE